MTEPVGGRLLGRPVYTGGNSVRLLSGGDELFPAMARAIDAAQRSVWLATYIWTNEGKVQPLTQALVDAARRGVVVNVLLDGFGCRTDLPGLRSILEPAGVHIAVFRPMDRWWNWLQPGQLRRMHQKMCVVDEAQGFIGGVNLLDDRLDHVHGWLESPRLDFAAALTGPVVESIAQATRALFTRAQLGRQLGRTVAGLARSSEPVARARRLMRRLKMSPPAAEDAPHAGLPPVVAAFLLRDNLRRRRSIERAYIDAIRKANKRVDLITPYFYPGRAFRRVLKQAARRGVEVRLLLQGKVDYQIAALAAQALYAELLADGVRIFEYTPAHLHAKVAVVDDDWCTVGSSNIDPLSLLLNLEANVVFRDKAFAATLAERFDAAVAVSTEVDAERGVHPDGLQATMRRWWVGWCAHIYLRIAGATGRY